MIIGVGKYKRVKISLALTIIILMVAGLSFICELELAGSWFSTILVLYVIFNAIIRMIRGQQFYNYTKTSFNAEMVIIATLMVVGLITGAVESFPTHMIITILYTELSVFLVIAGLILISSNAKNQQAIENILNWTLLKQLFWVGVVAIGTLIAVLTIYEYEPVVNLLAFIYFLVLFIIGIRWFLKQLAAIINLKNEKAKNELLHLQSQVNPHFFFNTLNNLYGLVEIDAKKAQKLILKLSDMMRYSIYDGQKGKVTLNQEVAYLKNYIALHTMRYHKKIQTRFEKNIDSAEYEVMPLLFIILLENAFKHGVENLTANAFVHIDLTAQDNQIRFSVENNYDSELENQKTGIGLENLKRRLTLRYPNRHELSFKISANVYKANLILKLL